MFVGRIAELNFLKEKYQSNNFEFGLVYGRSRIGKTSLLKESIKDNQAMYFISNPSNSKNNLDIITYIIQSFFNDQKIKFNSYYDMFDYLFNTNNQSIYIFDDFISILEDNPSIELDLLNIIDKYKGKTKIKLIITGNSIYLFESLLLNNKQLYQYFTFSLLLGELNYYDSSMFYPNFSNVDKVRAYAVFGGLPYYLSLIDDKKSLKDNIIDLLIKKNSQLEKEIEYLFFCDLRSEKNYISIISVLADRVTKLNDISSKTHINNNSDTQYYLDALVKFGIIEKETPFYDFDDKRTIYKLKNNLIAFYYRFININLVNKEFSNPSQFYDEFISSYLDEFTSFIFEDICMDFLLRESEKPNSIIPKINQISRYWYNNSLEKIDIEIDICIETIKSIMAFECKWTNGLFDKYVIESLSAKVRAIPAFKITEIGGFSGSGFTNEVINDNQYLFTLDELYKD